MPEMRNWYTHDLDEHVTLIRRQVYRALEDPETRQLATKIVSGKPDGWWVDERGQRVPIVHAWGESFILPRGGERCRIRDDWCEVVSIWNFWVTNVRYVADPPHIDLFATLEWTLKAGGGDCDDAVCGLAALLRAVGFEGVVARVISTSGRAWEHVYTLVGLPKRNPQRWYSLDPTVEGVVPGWEYRNAKLRRDYVI
jgi:hypothetical protein